MERIRQRIQEEENRRRQEVISIRSSNSGGSIGGTASTGSSHSDEPPSERIAPVAKHRAARRVIEDSDDEADSVQLASWAQKPQNAQPRQPVAAITISDSSDEGSDNDTTPEHASDSQLGRGREDPSSELIDFPVPQVPRNVVEPVHLQAQNARMPPTFPVPHPAKPFDKTSPPKVPLGTQNLNRDPFFDTYRPPPLGMTRPQVVTIPIPVDQRPQGAPIPVPTNYRPELGFLAPAHRRDEDEPFLINDDAPGYEPFRTTEEVEQDLKKLVEDAIAPVDEEFEDEEMFVEGFEEGIQLLPHQVLGRRWMRERETGKKMGGILADDMGLGKTIQTIVRIVEGKPTPDDKKAGWSKSNLVVCPVTLMDQWEREIRKVAPQLRVVQHHGPSRASDPVVLSRNHVVITSYQLVSNEYATFAPEVKEKDAKKKKKAKKGSDSEDASDSDDVPKARTKKTKKLCALFGVQWFRIILDEAHNIKNKAAKMSIAACELPGKYRWLLTGTPLQNNVEELYPLFKFLRIKPLNDWVSFKQRISDPVKKGRTKGAMKALQVVLKSVMLRRTKTTIIAGKAILTLPDRNVMVMECEFDEEERTYYDALASKTELTFNKFLKQGEVMKNYTSVLTLLLRLRQACNHPLLIEKGDADPLESTPATKDDDEGLATALEGLTVASDYSRCAVCQVELWTDNHNKNSKRCSDCDLAVAMQARRRSAKLSNSNLPPDSAKIRKILDLIAEISSKEPEEDEMPHKTIIFSQFTSFLDILEKFLDDERIKYTRLDGTMHKDHRAKAIEKIKKSKTTNVFLVSFKAGSTGLNLTCCDHVILTDLWWNPALEDQAFDRAHRYGQTRDVNIYKLTVPNTVEQRILQLQEAKRGLAAAALSGEKFQKNLNKLKLEDLMALFHGGHIADDEDD